jgi:dimeric dUTPase (all-alpha-NTP-PPase superfamily)
MTSHEILKEMFTLQQTLNDDTNGKGWEEGYTNQGKFISWKRCIHMECGELIDSFAWKHWKHIAKPTDWENVRVEVVDIWHFVMSLMLEQYHNENRGNIDQLIEDVSNTQGFHDFCKEAYSPDGLDSLELINDIESLIHICTGYELDLFDGLLRQYFDVALKCGINLTILYRYYVAKNVLNRFRQDNGYKEGSYQKTWNGKEDNVVMLELLDEKMPTPNELYEKLSSKYKALCA